MPYYGPDRTCVDSDPFSLGDEAAIVFANRVLNNECQDNNSKELIQLGWHECRLRAQARELVLRQLLAESSPFVGLLSKRQLGELLNLPVAAIDRLRDKRVIPDYRVGGAFPFRYPEVLKALERYRIREIRL